MFQLLRLDVWPTGDLGVRKGFGLLGECRTPTPKQLERSASRTGPTVRRGVVLLRAASSNGGAAERALTR